MTSNDNQQFITVEVFRSEIGDLRTEIRGLGSQISELKSEIQAVRDIAIVNSTKIEAYWSSTNTWFTVIAILVGIIGLIATLAPMFREIYKDVKEAKKHNDIRELSREIIREEMNPVILQAVHDAVAKALGVSGK